MKRILVTGAGGNASRNFIASLRMAREPVYIVGTDTNPYHLACTELDASYQTPRCDDPAYTATLRQIIGRERVQLVHPQPDTEVAFLSAHRHDFPVRWFLPEDEVIRRCHNKMICNVTLAGGGVSVPQSLRVTQLSDVPRLFDMLRPVDGVVWVRAIRGAGSRAALPVRSPRQARSWIEYWCENKGLTPRDFMIAEFLPGTEFAFQSLWHEGRLITSMARERMEYLMGNLMPSGQSSSPSVARTVHREDVNHIATKAVLAVAPKPHGVFCVDLKENAEGQPCVTEINVGRFFTTSNFFSSAGCNMPDYYLKLAYGEALPPLAAYNPLPPELYWVRGVDRAPKLLDRSTWTMQRAA